MSTPKLTLKNIVQKAAGKSYVPRETLKKITEAGLGKLKYKSALSKKEAFKALKVLKKEGIISKLGVVRGTNAYKEIIRQEKLALTEEEPTRAEARKQKLVEEEMIRKERIKGVQKQRRAAERREEIIKELHGRTLGKEGESSQSQDKKQESSLDKAAEAKKKAKELSGDWLA